MSPHISDTQFCILHFTLCILHFAFISGCGAVGSARRLGRRCRRFESCHSDQKSKREDEPLSCFFDWCVNLKLFCEVKCRFAFPTRRSTSSLVRQRAWESRSVAKLPCHSDQIWLWEAIPEAFFFVSSDANFEGWRLFSSALAFYHLDKLELV